MRDPTSNSSSPPGCAGQVLRPAMGQYQLAGAVHSHPAKCGESHRRGDHRKRRKALGRGLVRVLLSGDGIPAAGVQRNVPGRRRCSMGAEDPRNQTRFPQRPRSTVHPLIGSDSCFMSTLQHNLFPIQSGPRITLSLRHSSPHYNSSPHRTLQKPHAPVRWRRHS